MNIDISPRGAGKTTRAIEWLRKDLDKRILLTFSNDEENRLKKLYPDCSHRIVDWKSYVLSIARGGSSFSRIQNPRIMVDNADIVLQKMLDYNITDVSFTKDEINLR